MRTLKTALILLVVSAFLISMVGSCANETNESEDVPSYFNNNQVINIAKNQTFYIYLIAPDRDRGYRWFAYYDNSMIEQLEKIFQPNLDNRSEFGDTEWFKFKALEKGATDITLSYMEFAAEGSVIPVDEKVFTINIE